MSPQAQPCSPSGDGLRCVGREREGQLATVTATDEGVARYVVDFASPPFSTLPTGATRHFQFRYNDAGGTLGFNWSEPVKVKFCE